MSGSLFQPSTTTTQATVAGSAASGPATTTEQKLDDANTAIQNISSLLYVGYIVLLVTVAGMTIAVCAFVFSAIRERAETYKELRAEVYKLREQSQKNCPYVSNYDYND